jgi:hypothetical protein
MGFLYLNIKKSMSPDAIGLMMVWKCIGSKLISNSKQSNANLIGNSITWSKELYCSARDYSLQISESKCDCKFKANCSDACLNCFAPFPVVWSLWKSIGFKLGCKIQQYLSNVGIELPAIEWQCKGLREKSTVNATNYKCRCTAYLWWSFCHFMVRIGYALLCRRRALIYYDASKYSQIPSHSHMWDLTPRSYPAGRKGMTVLSTQRYAWYVTVECLSTGEVVHNRIWD